MKILEPVFISVIEKLIHNEVEFLMIGGYAVNYHGYGRYTGDIDFWINPNDQNKERFLTVFGELCKNKNAVETVKHYDFNQAQVFSLGEPPIQIDFLTQVNLVDFEDAWKEKVFFQVKDIKVPVVNYYHLITMKFNTGRTKDKLDLEQLQRINSLKNKK